MQKDKAINKSPDQTLLEDQEIVSNETQMNRDQAETEGESSRSGALGGEVTDSDLQNNNSASVTTKVQDESEYSDSEISEDEEQVEK